MGPMGEQGDPGPQGEQGPNGTMVINRALGHVMLYS